MCILEKGRRVYCHLAVSCNNLTKARSQSGYGLGEGGRGFNRKKEGIRGLDIVWIW